VSSSPPGMLLPLGVDVPFSDIELALGRSGADERRRVPGRALTATLVVLGSHARLAEAAEAVEQLPDIGVRAILISNGTNPAPTVRVHEYSIALDGLRPDYLNNAVAALRLSSLLTVVWWRGGAPEMLDGLADLADRLIFDAEEPGAVWARAAALAERTAISDIRWARLTRWRALMAHFFDIPDVRREATSFNRLRIEGADVDAGRLYAGWLASSLRWTPDVAVDVRIRPGGASIERIELGDGEQALTLQLVPGTSCVETAVRVKGHVEASRVVSLGDQRLAVLLGEELRIRSRDLAFEHAVAGLQGVA